AVEPRSTRHTRLASGLRRWWDVGWLARKALDELPLDIAEAQGHCSRWLLAQVVRDHDASGWILASVEKNSHFLPWRRGGLVIGGRIARGNHVVLARGRLTARPDRWQHTPGWAWRKQMRLAYLRCQAPLGSELMQWREIVEN